MGMTRRWNRGRLPGRRHARCRNCAWAISRMTERKRTARNCACCATWACSLLLIELPKDPPAESALVILNAEAAAAFDDLLRTGNTAGLNAWPAAWREAQFATAVDYIRANRVRTLLMRNMHKLFETVDLYVGGQDLVITNLTGHPTVVMPNGLRKRDGVDLPSSITFTGNLFGEAELLRVAEAYQRATGFHRQHPNLANT